MRLFVTNRRRVVIGAALAIAAALTLGVGLRAKDGSGSDKDKKVAAVHDATVHFGQHQPQTPDPAPVGASTTHFLFPEDVTIAKGGTVTFVVNGGGHGIAIHEVNKKTTREDIAAGRHV
jgi:plastocyanin